MRMQRNMPVRPQGVNACFDGFYTGGFRGLAGCHPVDRATRTRVP